MVSVLWQMVSVFTVSACNASAVLCPLMSINTASVMVLVIAFMLQRYNKKGDNRLSADNYYAYFTICHAISSVYRQLLLFPSHQNINAATFRQNAVRYDQNAAAFRQNAVRYEQNAVTFGHKPSLFYLSHSGVTTRARAINVISTFLLALLALLAPNSLLAGC